jgi:hypothetical protein
MKYLRLYEEIDFSDIDDIDDIDIECVILLIGSGGGGNFFALIDKYSEVKIFGMPYRFGFNIIKNVYSYNNIHIGNDKVLDLDNIDIRELIPGIVIVGEDVSINEIRKDIDHYKCENIDKVNNKLKNILKEYLD